MVVGILVVQAIWAEKIVEGLDEEDYSKIGRLGVIESQQDKSPSPFLLAKAFEISSEDAIVTTEMPPPSWP